MTRFQFALAGLGLLVFIFASTFAFTAVATPQVNSLQASIQQAVTQEKIYGRVVEILNQRDFHSDQLSELLQDEAVTLQALDELSTSPQYAVRQNVLRAAEILKNHTASLGNFMHFYLIYRQAGGPDVPMWSTLLASDKKSQLLLKIHPHSFSKIDFFQTSPGAVDVLQQSDSIPVKVLRDLVNVESRREKYADGAYANVPRIYMFCRNYRAFPCRILIKDKNGTWRMQNGDYWSQRALGFSRSGKKYNETNGNTPSGVLRIDGVMPEPDQPRSFGKYRRLIINMVEPSKKELNHKLLLPPSSHKQKWWKEAVVARDIGRGLFRVHGTGQSSTFGAPYYPLRPTSGCVAQTENTYDGVTYHDQRHLLDELMLASALRPIYENEVHIRALLYIVNINDEAAPVELEDLRQLQIIN